jgi:hypothetical protein
MSFHTITLKLHKPGREKRQILNEAMVNYTRAFDFLLQEARKCHFDPKEYRTGSKYKLSNWINKDLTAKLNEFQAEPFKDSLKLDFAMTFSSYLELRDKGKKAGFPRTYADSNGDLASLRSVFFCRYDTNRNFCLLYDKEKSRYFIKLYLLNQKSARKSDAPRRNESRLEYVHRNKCRLEGGASKCRFIIVPLAFGKWQEGYLKQALDAPEIIKTARLVKRDDEFFITVNMSFPVDKKIKPETFLGISRGPENSVGITITDRNGAILESSQMEPESNLLTAGNTPSAGLYRLANNIVDIAVKNKAQIILENLSDYKDGIYEVDFGYGKDQKKLSKSAYQALDRILDYKLEYAGLPKPIRVSPFGIFSTCPQCGLNTKRSRSSKGIFLCISCGAAYNIRNLGSLNLANKLMKYNQDNIKIKITREASGIKLTNEILGLELTVSDVEDVMERLAVEIEGIVEEARQSGDQFISRQDYMRKWSMIQKIESLDDFTKHITFI